MFCTLNSHFWHRYRFYLDPGSFCKIVISVSFILCAAKYSWVLLYSGCLWFRISLSWDFIFTYTKYLQLSLSNWDLWCQQIQQPWPVTILVNMRTRLEQFFALVYTCDTLDFCSGRAIELWVMSLHWNC